MPAPSAWQRCAALTMLIAGCAAQTPYQRPSTPLPKDWRTPAPISAAAGASGETGWWSSFGDPVLLDLQQRALLGNPDLRIAIDHLLAARDLVRVAQAREYPSLLFRAGPTDPAIVPLARGGGRPRADDNHYALGFEASYELDLWGRVSGAVDAARADALAGEFDADAARLTLERAVASAYFDLRDSDDARALEARKSALAEERVRLLALRLDAGRIGAATVLDARRAVLEAQGRSEVLAGRRQTALLELQTLLGDTGESLQIPVADLLRQAPDVPAGLPSSLLERRPDVRAAEARLAAAYAQIGIARAERFPQLALTAQLGYLTAGVTHILHSGSALIGIGPGISVPLFDGGRGAAEVDARRHEYDAALAGYQKSILDALKDVEAALLAYRSAMTAGRRLDATGPLGLTAYRHLEMAQAAGRAGRLDVIEAQARALDDEDTALGTRRARLDSLVALYQALGGDWRNSASPTNEQAAPDERPASGVAPLP